MTTEARDFDKDAARWDEHPTRVQLAQDVASAIARAVPLGPTMGVLDVTAAEVVKPTLQGALRTSSVFLVAGRKAAA